MILAAALLAQAAVQVPVAEAPRDAANPLTRPADPARLSLVIADAARQDDPRHLCPDQSCGALYRGRFEAANVVAGLPLPASFTARIEMGSPYSSRYRLALVVEQREGAEPLVRATRGFNVRTGDACFANGELANIAWRPIGDGIAWKDGVLCVAEAAATP